MGQNAKFVHRKISNFAHLKFFNYCLLTEQSVFTILVSLKPRYLKDQHWKYVDSLWSPTATNSASHICSWTAMLSQSQSISEPLDYFSLLSLISMASHSFLPNAALRRSLKLPTPGEETSSVNPSLTWARRTVIGICYHFRLPQSAYIWDYTHVLTETSPWIIFQHLAVALVNCYNIDWIKDIFPLGHWSSWVCPGYPGPQEYSTSYISLPTHALATSHWKNVAYDAVCLFKNWLKRLNPRG